VPEIEILSGETDEKFPYSFATVTAELDSSIATLSELLVKLIRLAEVEKTCNMLADEIEKNRRRVNALEYVMIPELQETIKYITMKLDENERANIIRLMKVKDMIEQRDQ
ncbi:MAG: V-type ATP synthase subunit D, partial [Christensenellales bacterium]